MAEEQIGRRLSNLNMVWKMAGRYPGRIFLATLALFTSAAATLAIPEGFRRVIDRGFAAHGGDIAAHFYALFAIVMVMAIATAVRFYSVSWLGERVVADLRKAVQDNLLRLEPRFFEENRPSEIASRLTSDTALIDMVVGSSMSVALRNTVLAVGGTIYLFTLAPMLTAELLVATPIMILPVMVLGNRVRRLARSSQDRVADVGVTIAETLGAMKVVQAFGQEERESARFGAAAENAFNTGRRRNQVRAFMTAAVIGLMFGSITLVMWQAALDVQAGKLSGGTVAAFVVTGGLVASGLSALTEVYGELLRGAGAAGRLAELLVQIPEIKAPANPIALPEAARGEIIFDHVTFHYPTRPEVSALEDFSLHVRPGETVALVGPSGAGKTTIFQLAERFYDPASGSVRLDGVDLREADPADFRQRIAMVPQETMIFAASARDNIRYARWDAGDDELWAAAEAANAAEFLRRLPQGLDTFLGEGGARLSGGYLPGRGRCPPFGRPAPACRDRARAVARCPLAPSRRGDVSAGRRIRTTGAKLA